MKKIICILLAAVALLLAVSCKKDDTEIPKETEPKEVTEAPKEPVIPEARSIQLLGQVITRVSGHMCRWRFHSSVT